MAKPPAIEHCAATGKVRHATEPAALAALASVQKRAGFDGPMDRWRCTHCGGWHFGHRRRPLQAKPTRGQTRQPRRRPHQDPNPAHPGDHEE